MATPDWRYRAACRDEDPELFFPVGKTGPALIQIGQAKAVCHRCTVASQCLAWALETGQDDGVWGGMSEDERRAPTVVASRSRTDKSDRTLDLAVVERALNGHATGRALTHLERVEVARRLSAADGDGDGTTRLMQICGCSGSTARRLFNEAKDQAA